MNIADIIISKAKQTPYWHLQGYMNRFWLVPYTHAGSEQDIGCGVVKWYKRPVTRLLQLFGVAIRVHNILRSDDDRAFHDHPWPYLTIILKGGYWEVQPVFESGMYVGKTRTWRGPGSVMFRPAQSWHYLEIEQDIDCWTLFCTGPKKQAWGFLVHPESKQYYRDYLGMDKDET